MIQDKKNSFLAIRVEGPAVGASRIRLWDFLLLGHEIMRTVQRVAIVLSGHADSRRTGRRPEEIRKELSLDLVGFTHGSQAAVLLFDRTPAPRSIEQMDLGREAYERWLEGLNRSFAEDEPLPAGYDLGVLMAVRDMGGLFDRGVSQVQFTLNHRQRRVETWYTGEKRVAIQKRIAKPDLQTRTIEGRLTMADFREGGCRIRVEPSAAPPVVCVFSDDLKEAVYENILYFVRVAGVAQTDPETGIIRSIRLTDIVRLSQPEAWPAQTPETGFPSPGVFWEGLTIDELAEAQGVQPIQSFEDALGGWPEGEEDDHFEEALEQWRTADVESPR